MEGSHKYRSTNVCLGCALPVRGACVQPVCRSLPALHLNFLLGHRDGTVHLPDLCMTHMLNNDSVYLCAVLLHSVLMLSQVSFRPMLFNWRPAGRIQPSSSLRVD